MEYGIREPRHPRSDSNRCCRHMQPSDPYTKHETRFLAIDAASYLLLCAKVPSATPVLVSHGTVICKLHMSSTSQLLLHCLYMQC